VRTERGGEPVEKAGQDALEVVVDSSHLSLRERDQLPVDALVGVVQLDESPRTTDCDRVEHVEQMPR